MSTRLNTEIRILIAVPDWKPEDATPLQRFSPSLCENFWIIRMSSFLPSNIFDLTEEGRETFLARKMAGTSSVNWHPQSPQAITFMPLPAFVPFTLVLLGKGQDPQYYARWVKSSEVPPTIIAETNGDLNYEAFNLEGLKFRFLDICDQIPDTVEPDDVRSAKAAIDSWVALPERSLGYQVGGHGSVTPNLMALSACGFNDMVYGPFKEIAQGTNPYIEQISQTARSILEERHRVGEREANRTFRRPPDLNLFAPAIVPDFFKGPVPQALDGLEKRAYRQAKDALQKQSGYQFEIRNEPQARTLFGVDITALSSRHTKPQPHPLFMVRQRELALGTECVGALAASEISAVLRLPNDINRTAGAVRLFASHYRAENAKSGKRLRAFQTVQRRLARAFPEQFYEIIRNSTDGIRVIADAHLEWLDIDGLPLAIRKNLSRVPVTPGNLFVEQITVQPLLHMTTEDFKEILVISALKRDDPIRPLFETAFEVFGKEWKDRLDVNFVDVASEDQLVAAINEFTGALLIFDGHGSHKSDEPGYIYLMETPIDVWALRGKIDRPPPIVVLSACDTHAADRNHATTANGFLSLGTRAVLGSVFPLSAPSAATFAARLIFRISSFIPAAVGLFNRSLNWTEVVSGMLRMQLLTDFLRRLEKEKIITQDVYIDVHQKGNMAINSGHEDPFLEVRNLLQSQGLRETLVNSQFERTIATSSVISYLNIGRPETILVDTKERLEQYNIELVA